MLNIDDLLEYQRLTQPPVDPMDNVLALADDSTPAPQWWTVEEAPEPEPAAPMAQPQTQPMAFSAPAPVPRQPKEAYPSDSSAGGDKSQGGVDPGLAFWAAFSRNPVLQQMLQEQQNAPAKAAAERRAQEKWQLERDIMSPLKAQKTRGEIASGQQKLEDRDPNSPRSKATRRGVAQALSLHAGRMAAVDPDMAKQMQQAALMVDSDGVSAAQALEMASTFGGIGGAVMRDAQQAANRASAEASRKDASARGWASLNEQKRHNQAMEEANTQKIDAKVQGNQDKLNEKIEGLNNAEELLDKAAEAKKNVDVGPIATPFNKLRQYTPWPNQDFDTLQQNLGSVRNEIKLLKAGKAVTANEEKGLNEELANLEQLQDDPTFESKLQGMRDRLAGYKKRAINQYQRKGGGETVDRSNTARVSTKQEPSLTQGEQRMKAPPGKAPGSMVRQKSTGKLFRVTDDGMLEEVR